MKPIFSALMVLALVAGAAATKDDDGGWSGAAGILVGNHDNFFFRGPGAAAPSSAIRSGYVDAEWLRNGETGELTLVIGGIAALVSDIDDADYQIAHLGLEYKRGPFKYGGTLAVLLNRLFVEEGDPVFFDETGFEGWVRYSVSRRLWVRGTVELAQQDFDPPEDDRDADVRKVDVTARYALTSNLGFRAAVLWEDRDADGPRNNRQGVGFALGIEGQPTPKVAFSLRVRRREREYGDAPVLDTNFGREDTVTDVNLNLRWSIRKRWGLEVRNEYRDGDSNRVDRNYDGNYASAGIFVKF